MPTTALRQKEENLFNAILKKTTPEMLAVYGRRRIGKTYLVREFFSKKAIYFEATGLKDGSMQQQLKLFTNKISGTFFGGIALETPKSWLDALTLLTKEINKIPESKKVVVFLDELPWLATKRSQLMQSLDHIWNTLWSKRKNLILILCGSAASWMLDNLINAKGGLHNRITQIILLKAFTLAQTKLFLKEKNIKLSDKNILDIYMIIGGVPYYLQELQKSLSVAQNINRLCFSEDAILNTEFDRLFKALFDEAEVSKTIIRAIAEKHKGLSREDLIKATKISSGGTLHKRLRELEAAGFIKSYIPYGYKKRETFYRIIDEYSLFYLRWIEPINQKGFGSTKNQWQSLMQTSSWQSWSGYAFEAVCFKHVNQITKALELENSVIGMSSWRYLSKKGQKAAGAQIDLLLERNDNAFTICEIKYSNKLYLFDKATAKNLANKVMVFEEETKAQKQVFVAMITIFGIKPNIWSEDLVNNSVTLSDLFEF